MNRTTYRQTRALIRANGQYALRWITPAQATVWRALIAIAEADDMLAWRARWMASPHDMSRACVIRCTTSIGY